MALSIGTKLVHYEITSEIGRGGMGEVYQAKDTKLGRDVAIKVLPEEFALDKDRVARFQREAKLLASLNHPNIAAIHGLEESEGMHFLVMELIEGQTLSDRIKTGPIPVEEALKLALQMAEALEAAHENGVIHRDLKPANTKVTPDGKVKILDFGLAKAYAGDQENLSPMDSPTISAAATQKGVILGTAAYMSPEQAKGKSVDKRADIWAFGVVLFEMLTGRQLFTGETVSDTLASVLAREPKWETLPPNLHPRILLMLERCLEKDPKRRYSGINDALVDIDKALTDPGGMYAQPIVAAEPGTKSRQILVWTSATVILLIIAGIIGWILKTHQPRQVTRFDYHLPKDQQMVMHPVKFDVSPDGKHFVYGTLEGLYLRSIDELNAKLIPGSDGPSPGPFFSPDAKSIGYYAPYERNLKTIAVGGGAPVVICDVEGFRGGSWSKDDFIVFGDDQGRIMRVSSKGGTPAALYKMQSEAAFGPQILPDGKTLLYTNATLAMQDPRVMVKSLNSEEPKELLSGWAVRYLPSGHLAYVDIDGNLCAVPFDLNAFEITGDHVPLVPGDIDFVALSESGTLIYTSEVALGAGPQNTLVWVHKDYEEEPLDAPPNPYSQPRISPDGKRIALVVGNYPDEDIYVWDIERKNLTKLTLDESREIVPVWTPDSKRIIYWSTHENATQGGIYWRPADGSGSVEKLISASDRALMPWSITRNGKFLLMQELPSLTNGDIGMLSMDGDYERKPLLQNIYSEAQPTISPDGQWLAYASDESTREMLETEVYIRPFPGVEESKTQVSTGGGSSPVWAPDGSELFYLSGDNAVMAVTVRMEPTLSLGTPSILFQGNYHGLTESSGTPYDIHPDGNRFIMIKPPPGAYEAAAVSGPRKITIVLNWDVEVKERVPVD